MPDPMTTRQQMRTARFATHPDGGYGARLHPTDQRPWRVTFVPAATVNPGVSILTDDEMVAGGWEPDGQSATTILADLSNLFATASRHTVTRPGDILIRLVVGAHTGYTVWQDTEGGNTTNPYTRILYRKPPPSNARNLARLIQEAREETGWKDDADRWADWLDRHGVRAPNQEEEEQ